MTTETKQRTVYVLTRTNKADDDDTDIYVGSTSKSLNQRLCCHRYAATIVGNENNKLYKRMRAVGIQNWEIIPLLSRTCDIKTIRELERKWCGIMHTDLNTLSPITAPDEKRKQKADYYETNKEAISKYQADYYEANKEAISKRNADYRETNKEAISKRNADYYEANKEAISKRNADYYETNKEYILKQQADYYEANKEAISKRNTDYRETNKRNKVHYCKLCNMAFGSTGHLKRHLKTEKHFWNYIYSVD